MSPQIEIVGLLVDVQTLLAVARMSEALHMPKAALEDLIAILWREGFKVLGPVARDGTVAFDEVRKVSDLAVAMRETQEPGRYRLGSSNITSPSMDIAFRRR
jgi:hypothetical protein